MGAPKGNKFWKNRLDMSMDGRKLSIEDVELKIAEYIERCVDDKLQSPDWVGKDAMEVARPHMISMTIFGACVHLGITHETWTQWRKDKKYSEVLLRAETIFKSYNLEGATAGMLKESIVARIEGLADKQETTNRNITVTIQDE